MPLSEYQIYGLRLHADRPIPSLNPVPGTAAADVFIHLLGQRQGGLPLPDGTEWTSQIEAEETAGPAFRLWTARGAEGDYLRLHYTDGRDYTEFVIDPTGSRVWVNWTEAASLEGSAPLLIGPVLGCVLRARGVPCLHAAVALIGEKAIALVGHKGAGKSTTTAALRQAGCTTLTDDIAALDEIDTAPGPHKFLVQPGSPRLRLRPDAAVGLHGSLEALHPLWQLPENRPTQRYLDPARDHDPRPQHPVPLAGIYVLEARDPAMAAPSIVPLPPAPGLMTLTPHTYANSRLDKAGRAREFAFLSRLVAAVPLRRICRPDGLQSLPQITRAILDDARALTS